MRILLFGEYSNVHWALGQGLRALGHEVTVVSDGDQWKNYKRDIDLRRHSLGKMDTLRYLWQLHRLMPRLKDYDVVQLINPVFLDLRAERILPYYRQLRKQNRSMFMGAFGMDRYWVKGCLDMIFRYSDYNLGNEIRHSEYNDICIRDWFKGAKGELNDIIAKDCDGIVSGLYEYEMCYRPYFADKLQYIPFPIELQDTPSTDETKQSSSPVEMQDVTLRSSQGPLHFFIGIQPSRSAYKGTDIMLRALERLAHDYPERVVMEKAENVPFERYQQMIGRSDILLDQLYSYTPAMNGLLAMSKGLILVGGGEEEHYQLLGENELRPIVNVMPDEEDVYKKMEQLVLHPENIDSLKRDSVTYVKRHHDHIEVAKRYLAFWESRMR